MGTLPVSERDRTFSQPVAWITSLVLVAFHIGAVVALFFFTWKAFFIAMVLWWVAGGLGIGVGYHRLLTHRGYKTQKWVEYLLTICATLTLEGGPIFWVATHRKHHQNTDKEGDPHSPNEGGFWSHVGWLLTGQTMHNDAAELLPFVPDLRKDRFHVWISRWHWLPMTVLGIGLLAFGGWPCLLWGIFFRTVLGLHSTWLVNSATHMWGSRRFATGDSSRNSFWVAMLTFGEGWHNNHHAHPQSSRHGLAWYEIDFNWYGICLLKRLGLAWDVKARSLSEGTASSIARALSEERELRICCEHERDTQRAASLDAALFCCPRMDASTARIRRMRCLYSMILVMVPARRCAAWFDPGFDKPPEPGASAIHLGGLLM